MKRRFASILLLVVSVLASAAGARDAAAAATACEPGRIGAAAPCETEGDVTALAAELLVVKFGQDAPDFARERVARYAAEDDPASAKLWQGIEERALQLL